MAPSAKEPAQKEGRVSTTRSITNGGEKPSGPRSRKGVETRARLVSAAKEIFERDGFLDARISDIAERAGLSHGSFYHYFESKEEVFREVAAKVDERLSAPMDTVIFDTTSHLEPYDRIREGIRQNLEVYRDEARIMAVIEQVRRFDKDVAAAWLERHREGLGELAKSIRALQRRGLVDAELEPTIAAAALGSMTYRFPEMWFVQGMIDIDFDEGVDQLTHMFVRALGLDHSDGSRSAPAKAAETRS
jgi:AcrR family transcriptional regulator